MEQQHFSSFMLFFSLIFLAATRSRVNAHTLGLHRLSGENPTGDPPLPAIRGAFEVELNARFNSIVTGAFQTIFEYSTPGNDDDSIWLGQYAFSHIRLRLSVAGSLAQCDVAAEVSLDTLYSFKFGVDATNTTRLYRDGVEIVECANMLIPRDVPRDHFLKTGQYDQDFYTNVDPMKGAILGLQVKNLDGTPQHPYLRTVELSGPNLQSTIRHKLLRSF